MGDKLSWLRILNDEKTSGEMKRKAARKLLEQGKEKMIQKEINPMPKVRFGEIHSVGSGVPNRDYMQEVIERSARIQVGNIRTPGVYTNIFSGNEIGRGQYTLQGITLSEDMSHFIRQYPGREVDEED